MGQLLIFGGGWLALWLPIAFWLAHRFQCPIFAPRSQTQKLTFVLTLYACVPVAAYLFTEPESWQSIGESLLAGSFVRQLLLGSLFAISGILIVYALQAALGFGQWQKENLSSAASLALPVGAIALLISAIEETLFRGWLVLQLQPLGSGGFAFAISAFIFAGLHLLWERTETVPQIPGLWLLGFILSLAYDWIGPGLAWGLHAGWIWGLTLLGDSNLFELSTTSPGWLVGWRQLPLTGLLGWGLLLSTGLSIGLYHSL
ncbi:MAG: CPBP family intramembrane glutamic endopeptidase [Cyanobacteria bacterium P01_H01_bin.15]